MIGRPLTAIFSAAMTALILSACASDFRDMRSKKSDSSSAETGNLDLTNNRDNKNKKKPRVIVGIDGDRDHGEVETGVTDAVLDCYRKGEDCVLVLPDGRPEYYDPQSLCRKLHGNNEREYQRCVRDLQQCFRTGRCRVTPYDPGNPNSLPDILTGVDKPIVICHHVPTTDGSNPIWDCPCDIKKIGDTNPYWRCCFARSCADTAGGGTPDTPNPDSVLKIDELKNSDKLPPR